MADLLHRPVTPGNLLRDLRDRLGWVSVLLGRPSAGMRTDVTCHGRPVLFLHNPKTGGKSLRTLMGVTHLSHATPSERLNEKAWLDHVCIAAVRDPFERFLSGYFDHVRKPKENALTRIYGPVFKTITPQQYLAILLQNPRFGGPQVNWTDFPSPRKPRADIVLRFEEIGQWRGQLLAAGVSIGDRQLPHKNASSRAGTDLCAALDLTPAGLAALESEVRTAFAQDARAFGYPLP